MEKGVFRFKQFSCRHYGSSMRIGVDAVLLGAWSEVEGNRILDVGTGCGVVALMCAQRNAGAMIDAIDTDLPSVTEATTNFQASAWADRLHVMHGDFIDYNPGYGYDRIISNPPYFNSGVDAESSVRMHARHEGILSPLSLLRHSSRLLKPEGSVSIIIPHLRADEIISGAETLGFQVLRRVDVRGNSNAPLKRTLLEFGINPPVRTINSSAVLTLESSANVPTEEYRSLCKDFYLYF